MSDTYPLLVLFTDVCELFVIIDYHFLTGIAILSDYYLYQNIMFFVIMTK